MKKALVVFLILAVAGGLFAQTTVKFSGSVQTGLAIGFTDEDDNKPVIDFIRNRGEHGIRGDVQVDIASGDENSPYGKFGGRILLRGRDSGFFNFTDGLTALVPTSFIWWTPNSFVKIHIGTDGDGGYGSLGGLDDSQDVNGGHNGLKVNLTPIAGLGIAGSAWYGQTTIASGRFEDMKLGFGAKYTVTGLVAVAGNLTYNPNGSTDGERKSEINFRAGANFLGLSGLGITALAADVGGYNFGTNNNFLGIGERIAFATGGLTLGARAQQFIWMGTADYNAMPMLFQAELAYKVSPVVSVGVEGRYLMGNTPNFNWRNATEVGGVNNIAAFSTKKDKKALGISPSVTFNVGPQIVLGYNLQMDMSDGATGKTMQHLIFSGVNLSF